MKTSLTMSEHRERSDRLRRRLLIMLGGLILTTGGLIWYVIDGKDNKDNNALQASKAMTFDDFLKDSFTVFSSDEADIFRALHERSQSEFGELTNLSPEMFQKFTLSHTRLLIAQFRVYQGILNTSELLPRMEELIDPDIHIIAVRYNQQPSQKPRHTWFPDSISDSRGPGTYIALMKK